MFFFNACHPGWIKTNNVTVFVNKPKHVLLKDSNLAIINFQSSEPSTKLGLEVANIFKEKITKEYLFNKITVLDSLSIANTTQDSLIKKALFEAMKVNADFLLFGSIDSFTPAKAIETETTLSVKIINISTGETQWWGKTKVVGKPGKTFLLFNQFLSQSPPDVYTLLDHASQKIVNQICVASIEKKPNFISAVFNRLKPEKTMPYIKSAEEMEAEKHYQELEQSNGTTESKPLIDPFESMPIFSEPAAPEPPVFDQSMYSKDIIDKAFDDLNTGNNDDELVKNHQ